MTVSEARQSGVAQKPSWVCSSDRLYDLYQQMMQFNTTPLDLGLRQVCRVDMRRYLLWMLGGFLLHLQAVSVKATTSALPRGTTKQAYASTTSSVVTRWAAGMSPSSGLDENISDEVQTWLPIGFSVFACVCGICTFIATCPLIVERCLGLRDRLSLGDKYTDGPGTDLEADSSRDNEYVTERAAITLKRMYFWQMLSPPPFEVPSGVTGTLAVLDSFSSFRSYEGRTLIDLRGSRFSPSLSMEIGITARCMRSLSARYIGGSTQARIKHLAEMGMLNWLHERRRLPSDYENTTLSVRDCNSESSLLRNGEIVSDENWYKHLIRVGDIKIFSDRLNLGYITNCSALTVVLGPRGSGKTFFCKKMVDRCLRASNLAGYVPVYIDLRAHPEPGAYLAKVCPDLHVRLLVFIDGLSESTAPLERDCSILDGTPGLKQWASSKFVITADEAFYNLNPSLFAWGTSDADSVCRIRNFDRSDIDEYIIGAENRVSAEWALLHKSS